MGVLKEWGFSFNELDEIVTNNPSLRGMLHGYVAESVFQRQWLNNNPHITDIKRWDNHNRDKKGDITFTYKKRDFIIEVKSLQTNKIKQTGPNRYRGKAQCDASDKRQITLPNGDTLSTTCLQVGEFDVLAVNLFEFGKQWRFAFAINQELPRSRYKKYTQEQRDYLLMTLIDITWPPEPPFEADLFVILDKIIKMR
jgi:hypothetical protein